MRVAFRIILVAFGLAVVALCGWKAYSIWRRPTFEYPRAAESLPVIKNFAAGRVTFFRDQGLCQVLQDSDGAFASDTKSTTCALVDPKDLKPLEGMARARFEGWRVEVKKFPYAVSAIQLSLGDQGELQAANLTLVSSERESLSYSPNYILPENKFLERGYTPIDPDWFHVSEDQN